ncbi:unnamed protein product [Durusdinium trenchii]
MLSPKKKTVAVWIDVDPEPSSGRNKEGKFSAVAQFFGLWHEAQRGAHRGMHELWWGETQIFLVNLHFKAGYIEGAYSFDNRCSVTPEASLKAIACNPDGKLPCCSSGGWCGLSPQHCTCKRCRDFRKILPNYRHLMPPNVRLFSSEDFTVTPPARIVSKLRAKEERKELAIEGDLPFHAEALKKLVENMKEAKQAETPAASDPIVRDEYEMGRSEMQKLKFHVPGLQWFDYIRLANSFWLQEHQFAIQDACVPEPDFEATDSDCQESADDNEGFLLESDSGHFYASDAEEARPTAGSRKRAYTDRRTEKIRILGKTVCWKAGARLIGVGQTTLNKLRNGEAIYTQKAKVKAPVHPEFGFAMRGDIAEKWPSIVMFLWLVYHSAAECMPTPNSTHALKPKILQEAAFVEDREPDDITRHVNTFMNSLEKYQSDINIHMIGPGTFRGERRYLQHSSRSELYFEYVAYATSIGDDKPASHTTFLRVYWSMRTLSQNWFRQQAHVGERMLQQSMATNLCTIMADSMDQAKFKCPRIRDLNSKLLTSLFRPRLHCGGTWCHGRSLALAISDECLPKDSVIQMEQVARVLNSVYQDFNGLPLGLSYHADNTYRESKNRRFLAFAILLVALRVFRFSMASFLRAALIARHTFDNPQKLVEILDSATRPAEDEQEQVREQRGAPRINCIAYKLDKAADWKKWTSMLGIRLKGLRRVGQIRISLRRDIDASSYGHCEVQEIRNAEQSGDDLILLAKRFMADSEPFQVVTLMTAEQAATLRRSFAQPDGDWSRRPISDKVKRSIRTKAPLCVQQGVISVEAAAYLTNWAEGAMQWLPRPQSYQFLTHRAFGQDLPGRIVPWAPAGRERHIDLTVREDDEADSASDDAYAPIEDEQDS